MWGGGGRKQGRDDLFLKRKLGGEIKPKKVIFFFTYLSSFQLKCDVDRYHQRVQRRPDVAVSLWPGYYPPTRSAVPRARKAPRTIRTPPGLGPCSWCFTILLGALVLLLAAKLVGGEEEMTGKILF